MKEYVLTIIGISIITLIVDAILVDGRIKRYSHFAIAVILSIALIFPALNLVKNKKIPSLTMENQEIDYSFSVEQTVKAFYKNSSVKVSQDSSKLYKIYIDLSNEKILDKAQAEIFEKEIKKILSGIYSIDENDVIINY